MILPYLPHEIDAHPDGARIWATLEKYGVNRSTHELAPIISPDDVEEAEDSLGEIGIAADEARSAAGELEDAARQLRELVRALKQRYGVAKAA